MKCLTTALVTTILAATFSSLSRAEERRGGWYTSLRGGAVTQTNAGLSAGGDFSSNRWFVQPGFRYAFSRNDSIGVSVGFGRTDYDFDSSGNLEWGRIDDLRISFPMRYAPTDRISLIAIPSIRFDGEGGTDMGDRQTEGILAAASWQSSDSLRIGAGFGVFTSLDDDVNAFPILLLDWDITENLNLGNGRGIAASQGPGLVLSWDTGRNMSVGIGARYESRSFRLDDGADGIGSEESLPLYLTLDFTPWRAGSINLIAGVDLNGTLKREDSNGNTLVESDYDAAPFFGLSFAFRF